MGRLTLTELAYLLLTHREPTPGERRLLDAVLVSLADHGLTPSTLAARLTYTGAPEAIQGAVAAGLLGAGSVFLGPTGDTAEFLFDALRDRKGAIDDATLAGDRARRSSRTRIAAGLRVPGIGHPVHKVEDPRTPRLYSLAREESLLGPCLRLLEHVAAAHEAITGKRLPINGAGAGGALLVDLGVPPGSVRGFVLIRGRRGSGRAPRRRGRAPDRPPALARGRGARAAAAGRLTPRGRATGGRRTARAPHRGDRHGTRSRR